MELTACIHITPVLQCRPLSHEGKNVNNVGFVESEWKVKGKKREEIVENNKSTNK